MNKLITTCLVLALTVSVGAAERRNWFYDDFCKSGAIESFAAGAKWLPYPDYSDRAGWDSMLSPAQKKNLVKSAEKYLDYKWEWPTAMQYVEFERSGNRSEMERPLRTNIRVLNSLIAGELAEGKGRFIPQIADCMWLYSGQISWVFSAHNKMQPSKRALADPEFRLIDLFSAEAGMSLSFAWYFFREPLDAIDPSIRRALRISLEEKIFRPFFETDHWWTGFRGNTVNNWCPWCASNALLAFLLVHEDTATVRKAVLQSLKMVDNYMNCVPDDGSCDEGPLYFAHGPCKLYDYLQIMHDASGGAFNGFSDPKVRRLADYESNCFIGRYGGKEYVVNYADATATLTVSADLIWRFAHAVGSRESEDFALYLMGSDDASAFAEPVLGGRDMYRILDYLPHSRDIAARLDSLNALSKKEGFDKVQQSLRAEVNPYRWYSVTQQIFRRADDGTFFAAKGGHNGESHNHNDVGNFILFSDSHPLIIDPGAPTYMRQTFSAERYTLWPMQSLWHNVPVINGGQQKNGTEYGAREAVCKKGSSATTFSMDIAGAYPESACKSWKRVFTFRESRKGSTLVISDEFSLASRQAADIEHFITTGKVTLQKKGRLRIEKDGRSLLMEYPEALEASVETKALDDPKISDEWGPELYRISLRSADNAPIKGKYIIKISIE